MKPTKDSHTVLYGACGGKGMPRQDAWVMKYAGQPLPGPLSRGIWE
jgi:hypothetical protein